jgi:hypothetical protein
MYVMFVMMKTKMILKNHTRYYIITVIVPGTTWYSSTLLLLYYTNTLAPSLLGERNLSPYRQTWITHRCVIQLLSLKLKSLLRKCRTPKLWVMDVNSQHFRLEIQFLQKILIYRLGFSPKFLKLIPSIKKISCDCTVLGLFDAFPCELKLLNKLDRKRITF